LSGSWLLEATISEGVMEFLGLGMMFLMIVIVAVVIYRVMALFE
jgi:hypothetical protein